MRHAWTSRWETAAALALLALASASLTGCAAAGGGNVFLAPQPAATVMACNKTEGGCASEAAYSLASLRDLSITINWSHVPEGTHTGTIEIMEPGGGVYQTRNVAFLADVPDASSQTSMLVPVAGTWIVQREVTGQWAIQISLDGQLVAQQNIEFQP